MEEIHHRDLVIQEMVVLRTWVSNRKAPSSPEQETQRKEAMLSELKFEVNQKNSEP